MTNYNDLTIIMADVRINIDVAINQSAKSLTTGRKR